MSMSQRYAMGMLSGAGSVVLRAALNIMVVPVIIAKLGLEVFGLYIVLVAILEVATFLDLGATSAIVTLLGGLGDESAESTSRERRAILKVGHAWFGVLSALFLGVALLMQTQFCELFHIKESLRGVAMTSYLLMVVEATLALYSYYCHTVLLANCAQQWTNIADSAANLLTNMACLLVLLSGYGLVEMMIIRLAASILRTAVLFIQTARMEPFAFRPGVPFSLKSFLELARLSGHSSMINLSIIISHKVDDLVIAHFLPLSAVGIYEIVFRMLGITLQIGLKLTEGIYTVFAKLAANRQVDEARQIFIRKSAFLNIVSVLILMNLVAFYPELFALFSAGKIPIAQTLPILAVALPCVLSGVLQMPANAWLFTWGHQRFVSTTSLCAALANLVLSIILVKQWGIVGAALGTLIPQLFQHQLGLIGQTCRQLGIGAFEYIRTVHLKALLPLAAALAWVLMLRPFLPHAAFLLPTIVVIGATAAFIGAAVWFQLNATPQEREVFRQMLLKVFMVKLPQPIQHWFHKFSPKIDPDQAS
jgi:O-antigen/teichoic acid export membrane protein